MARLFPGSTGGSPVTGITPLTAVCFGDANGAATTPNGACSGTLAFNGATALQDCVNYTNSTGGGGIWLAPGDYSGDDSPITINEQLLRIVGMGPANENSPAGVKIIGTIELDASDSRCALTLEDLTGTATVTDLGTGGELVLRNAQCGQVSLTGAVSSEGGTCNGTVQCAGFNLFKSTFVDTFTSTQGIARDCTFLGAVSLANGLTTLRGGSALAITLNTGANLDVEGTVLGGNIVLTPTAGRSRFVNCPITHTIDCTDGPTNALPAYFEGCTISVAGGPINSGTSSQSVVLENCNFTGSTATPLLATNGFIGIDSTTELRALIEGYSFDPGIVLVAVDMAQGGNAAMATAAGVAYALDFTGPTRFIIPRSILTVDITIDIAITGGKALQKFYIDHWNTGHTIEVTTDAGVTILVPDAGTMVSGEGERLMFQIDQDNTTVTFISREIICKVA